MHVKVQTHEGQRHGNDNGDRYGGDYFLTDVFALYNQLYLKYYNVHVKHEKNYATSGPPAMKVLFPPPSSV